MNILYSLVINCYYFLIFTAGFFNKKAKLWIEGRKNWESVLSGKIDKDKDWIWFHCSSLGEFEDCCEIFFKIQKENPSKKTILTVYSPSAFESLKSSRLFDVIAYLPLDTKRNAKTFLDIVNPEFILFGRSELWLYFLLEIKKREIPIFLISLKMNSKSNFIKWPFNIFYRSCFSVFDAVYCQDEETLQLLISHFAVSNTFLTGNTRFERVYKQSQSDFKLHGIENFIIENRVVVLGSCLPKDEHMFLEIYNKLKSLNIKWIVVPHEMEESILSKHIDSNTNILYSRINELNPNHDILVIDSVGLLKHIYKYADFALIGGGFDKIGIHNIIEPAVYGVQSAFGPNHRNYEEAIQLIASGGATVYNNSIELEMLINEKFSNPEDKVLKENIRQFVKSKAVSSSKITDSILARLAGNPEN